MRFDEIRAAADCKAHDSLDRLKALAHTAIYKAKVARAAKDIGNFMELSSRPAISCGGGKDGTAAAILARMINPAIPIYCANPPNPLPGRDEHVEALKAALGGVWIDVPYPWDVGAVLSGRIKYPHGLKGRTLVGVMERDGIDGVILGVRMAESKGRKINGILRGPVYKTNAGTWRCLPVLRWSAEETLALSLTCDIPINPVYYQTAMAPSLEYLRDGTWWPHGFSAARGYGAWIKHYYPNLYDDYLNAERAMDGEKIGVCLF